MRAKFLLLFCALLAIFGVLFPADNIANAAHLGGMVTGIFFIRFSGLWQWPRVHRPGPTKRLVKVPILKSGAWRQSDDRSGEEMPQEEFLTKEVDPILDKISAYGIQSLTDRERRILEAARSRISRR